MPLTREQGQAAFTHVVETVLASPASSPLAQALEQAGFDDIRDILIVRDRDIDTLVYHNGMTTIPLQLGHRGKLRAFLAFVDHCNASDSPIDGAWTEITQAKFSTFRLSAECRARIEAASRSTVAGKCDSSQHPTIVHARPHGIADVLKTDYELRMDIDKALFDVGKTSVCNHEGDCDAQAVSKEVVKYDRSTKAPIDASHLLECDPITNVRQCDSGQHSLVTQARHDSRRVDSRVMTHTSHPTIRPVEPAEVSTYDFVPVTLHDL